MVIVIVCLYNSTLDQAFRHREERFDLNRNSALGRTNG